MNDYFYGDSFGRLSLLDEVNIWRGSGVPGIWRYQLSGICCFTPKTPTQIFAFTLVGSTHRHSPTLTYSPRQFAFFAISCLFISRACCSHSTRSRHHKVFSSRVGVETPYMAGTRPPASGRAEDVQRTHLHLSASPRTNHEATSTIQGSKQWVPFVAGGYVFPINPSPQPSPNPQRD